MTNPSGAKSLKTALWLSILLGGLGIDRFYLGHTVSGVIKLVVTIVLSIIVLAVNAGIVMVFVWPLIDIFRIAKPQLTPANGNYV